MRRSNRASRAFTLIEVMVAMVIFGMVLASLYLSFRTGVKSYELGSTHSEAEQATRYLTSQVADDIRNIYYKPNGQYNVMRRQREAQVEEKERLAAQTGTRDATLDDANMPEMGPRIDLGFRGQDSGDVDDITFVRNQTGKRSEDRKMWSLARIHYFVSGNALYRSVDDIKAPDVDSDGNEVPKPYPPKVDKIANHVKGFDLKYGYWFEGQWKNDAVDWDSESAKYRNPPQDDEEDKGIQTTAAGGYTSSTQQVMDELPAWVEITYTFTDPKNEEKQRVFHQMIPIVESKETNVPPGSEADANTNPNQGMGMRRSGGHRR